MSPPVTQPAPRANAPVPSESLGALVEVFTFPTVGKRQAVVEVQLPGFVGVRERTGLAAHKLGTVPPGAARRCSLTAAHEFKPGWFRGRRTKPGLLAADVLAGSVARAGVTFDDTVKGRAF